MYSTYVVELFQSELTVADILDNSFHVAGVGFSLSFLLEGARKVPRIIHKKESLKESLIDVSKKSAINGLISGATSIIADSTENYITNNKTVKSLVAIASFTGLKYAYNRISEDRTPSSSETIVNMNLIPSYL